jgi:hypothetical protein
MADSQTYTIVTGNSCTDKTITFPNGAQSITLMNVGDNDATITFADGSVVPLRSGGGVFSLGVNTLGYKSMVVTATTTTIDYVVTGISVSSITIA